jgi:putative spermidine/putrescine transport system ATP-binding protein
VSALEIVDLHKSWGHFKALDGISLSVRRGEFVSFLGPSGCGKTTILRIVAGLIEPSQGTITLANRDITWAPIHKREIGLVFQSYALFPHKTVAENVAFGLRRRRIPSAEIAARVKRSLESVSLDHLAARYPRELSGGQQQRVALARAVVIEPRLLLLDEPLSNLDAVLRRDVGVEIKRLQEELGITTIFVTHDQSEALSMSDRICLLNHGRITQVGTPEEIYWRPASTFVATFMGRANILKGTCERSSADGVIAVRTGSGHAQISASGTAAPGAAVSIAIRQQSIALRPAADAEASTPNRLTGRVSFSAFSGSSRHVLVQLDAGPELAVEAPSGPSAALEPGTRVVASWQASDATLVAEDEVFQ